MVTSVKINIKSPANGVEDKEMTVSLDMSVLSLKAKIEADFDNHPAPKDQRLVYAGKMLSNDQELKDVLRLTDARDSNNAFTVHLVCRVVEPERPKKPAEGSESLRKRNASTVISGQSADSAPRQPTENRQAAANYQYPDMSHPDHAYLWHQMYAAYAAQYMQYLQSVNMAWPGPHGQQDDASMRDDVNNVDNVFDQPPVFNPVAAAAMAGAMANANNMANNDNVGVNPVNNNNNVNNNNVNVNNVDVNNVNNVVMNAGAGGIGAMEEEDDEGFRGRRDVLDWFYLGSRVLILFSFVYFYSSLARFTLAAGLAVVIYLYNNGFFGNNNRLDNNNQQEAAVEVVRQAQQQQQQQPEGQQNEEQTGNANESNVEGQEPRPNFFAVLSTFVSTFFTSLLPNDAEVPAGF